MRTYYPILLIIGTFFFWRVCFSQTPRSQAPELILAQAMQDYKKGAYPAAIQRLTQLERDPILNKSAYYFAGLCYNKLQEFEQAIKKFEQAVVLGASPDDLYYELGQAYYATMDYPKARLNFAKSVRRRHLISSSLYYIGYIGQILEEYHLALKFYKKIENAEPDVAQAASFQVGEIILKQAERRTNVQEIVKNFVIPQLQRSRSIASNSALGFEIEKRVDELMTRYDLDETKLYNGRQLPKNPFILKFKESLTYDTNVISEADDTTLRAEDKDTLQTKSDLFLSYYWSFRRKYVLTPSLRLTQTRHNLNRSNSAIVANDSYTLEPSLEWASEHYAFKKPASFLIELAHIYQAKDNNSGGGMSDLQFNNRSYTLSLGEKFQYWSCGDTTIKIKRKEYTSYSESSDSNTHTLSLMQTILLPAHQLMLLTTSLDVARYPNNASSDQDSVTARLDYIHPTLFDLEWNPALNIVLTDPKDQRDSRGIEKSLNPSLTITQTLSRVVRVAGKYEYNKNLSKDRQNYQYTQHKIGLDLNLSF